MDNLLFLSFTVICLIAAIMIFLFIKRRNKTKQYDLSDDDNIVGKNPLYFENNAEDQYNNEQEL